MHGLIVMVGKKTSIASLARIRLMGLPLLPKTNLFFVKPAGGINKDD
jgi:hypothetical protein